MEPNNSLTAKEAQGRLLLAYKEGDADGFRDFATRPLLNPIEQRDGKNKRKVHPMLVIGLVLLAVAVIATFFFSH